MEKIIALIITLISFIGALGAVYILESITDGLEGILTILGLWTISIVFFVLSAKELLS